MNARSSPHEIDVYVGARLKFRRKQLRISQADLGHALGMTFQQIQKYERGTNRISASVLYLAAQHIGVGIDFFYDGMPGATAKSLDLDTSAKVMAAASAVPAVSLISDLNRETQHALQLLIVGLARPA